MSRKLQLINFTKDLKQIIRPSLMPLKEGMYTTSYITLDPYNDPPIQSQLAYQIESEAHCIYLWGLYIDLNSFVVYLNREVDAKMIPFCSFTDVLRDSFYAIDQREVVVAYDQLPGAIQRYKMNGDLSQFANALLSKGGDTDGSVIRKLLTSQSAGGTFSLTEAEVETFSRSLIDNVALLQHRIDTYWRTFLENQGEDIKFLCADAFDKLSLQDLIDNSKTWVAYDRAYNYRSNLTRHAKDFKQLSDTMYKTVNRDFENYLEKDYKPVMWGKITKASAMEWGFLDVLDSMQQGNEIIYSTDMKKTLKQYGFDKLLSTKEISALVKNKNLLQEAIAKPAVISEEYYNKHIRGYTFNAQTPKYALGEALLLLGKISKYVKEVS